MTDTIYLESAIRNHPRTKATLARYPHARIIECEHHGEVFNPKSQNFRLQKQNPALILASKHKNHVLPAPDGYGIGSQYNFYFSHMLNCLYDCRYCFLQGMYRSANWVWFINYEDFENDIDATLAKYPNQNYWFFSGYDCDSLAYEPVTGFIEHFLPFFAKRPQASLEIRTKSTQIRALLKCQPLENVVIAFSFTPDHISKKLEHGVPTIVKRLAAIKKLQQAGWKIGLRFDPLIYWRDYQSHYTSLFEHVFSQIDHAKLHSVSLGAFRLPKPFFEKMIKLYPDEPLLAGDLTNEEKMVSYPRERNDCFLHKKTDKLRIRRQAFSVHILAMSVKL